MLLVETKRLFFRKKSIWFSEYPFDVEKCDAVFFHACPQRGNTSGFIIEESPTLIIDLTQDTDIIWKKMDPKSCRYEIRKAEKLGIEVRKNSDIQEFIKMYLRFAKQKNFSVSREDITLMRMKAGTFFTAYHDKEMLAGIMTLEDSERSRWLVGASKRLEADRNKASIVGSANALLIWMAILDAKDRGLREFDMGGYYLGEDRNDPRYRINSFKKHFGGTLVIYFKGKKYYSMLYRLFVEGYRLIKRV